MRQAGRYMPEYRALRAKHSLLELCKNPDLAAEITLQPVEHLGVDAAILFADLLLTALYGAAARAMRPKDAPAGFAAALAELNKAGDVVALLHEPEPPKVESPPVEAPKAESPPPATPSTTPEPPEVARLKAAIAALQDWPTVPEGPKLELGAEGPRVAVTMQYLTAPMRCAWRAPSTSSSTV